MKKEEIRQKRNQFGNLVNNYVKYRKGYPCQIYKLIFKLVPDKNAKVLDLACGTGISTQPLIKYYNNIYGLDKEKKMISFARKDFKGKKLEVIFKFGTAEKIPYKQNFFDLVIVAQAFHWFDKTKALKEIRRVLKNNGKLIIFWKLDRKTNLYLPEFIYKNLKKYSSYKLPHTSKNKLIDVKEILKPFGFNQIKNKNIEFKEKYEVDKFLGLVKSHSSFNLVPHKDQQRYLNDNTNDFKKYNKNNIYIQDLKLEFWSAEINK